MTTLVQRFVQLKTLVGGNREKQRFEFTFGQPREEQQYVTMPSGHIRRILAELQFAIALGERQAGAFDACIDASLAVLERGIQAEGVLTRTACEQAEQGLMPMAKAAKAYTVLCAAHAHIDMNWMWGFDETVSATLATFRTMLTLMREYPTFRYSQSQASVYKIVEDYAPEMMEEIIARIQEGRWEVTASAWVETDKNMPDTESLLRHIRMTRDYLQAVWKVPPESLTIDFSPDTFGHSAHLPTLNTFGGVKYYYHCRGRSTQDVLYRWRAPSGQEVLVYREPYWYNSGITPDIGTGAPAISDCSGGLKTSLIVYGVGDHGGGPTRRDLEQIVEMQAWPVFPEIRFGSFTEYFALAETVRDRLPVVDKELNAIFTGCYTTQSRIKRGNRRSEAALLDAEALAAAAFSAAGQELRPKRLAQAWQNVLFTHFHDILTGSCVQDTREHAMGLYQDALAVAGALRERAALTISACVDTSDLPFEQDVKGSQSEGAGAGYGITSFDGAPRAERGRGRVRAFHVFNPLTFTRDELIELTVWDWPYDLRRLRVSDEHGQPLAFEKVDATMQKYWDHQYFRVFVRVTVPSLGYCTVVLDEMPVEAYPTPRLDDERVHLPDQDVVLENARLRAVISGKNGALLSLVDKVEGRERVCPGAALGLVMTESATSSAWKIGRHLSELQLPQTVRIQPIQGNLRPGLTIEQRLLHSTIKTTITLDADSSGLSYAFEIDWHEYSPPKELVPVLVFRVPLAESPECIRMDVPAGALDRGQMEQDMPGLTHAAAVWGTRALALATDCKYGYRAHDDTLSVTLINTANSPDLYPERGVHQVRLWLSVESASPKALKEAAMCRTHALSYVSAIAHGGALAARASLLQCDAPCAVISSIGNMDGGAMRIRLYEVEGKGGQAALTLPFAIGEARVVDLQGQPLAAPRVTGETVLFDMAPYQLYELTVSPKP